MPLTDAKLRAIKPKIKAFKCSDGGGLYVWVTPSGTRTWRMDYRFDRKGKTLTLGQYPLIGLADARRMRDDAKGMLTTGDDPSLQKRLSKIADAASRASSFGVLADEYLAKLKTEGRAESTLKKVTWLLSFARPDLGNRPISEISSAEVLMVLRKIESRGTHETARRLRSTIGSVIRYAIATARAENDPTVALQGALITPIVTPRAAIIEPVAFGGLLRAIAGYDGQATTKAALQLLPFVFCRPGELRLANWSEFDLDAATWTIPAKRAKMRREHKKPLSRQSVAILRALYSLTSGHDLVFPSVRTWQRPLSENTINAALRRLGYSKDEATAHGFRATASTLLNESGKWNPDAIERELGHVEDNEVRRAYARGQNWDERVKMVQWWSDSCDAYRDGAKMIPFATAQK